MQRIVGFAAALFAGAAFAQGQGVSKNEIVIGTMQDLSGPIVAFSKQLKNGMEMRVEEINANGGIHGRKLKLVIEDHGYDPKKAVLATQKLVQKDRIFAMVGTIGTPTALPSMPILFEKNIRTCSRSRGARDVRAAAPPEVFLRRHLLRPDARGHQVHGEVQGLQEGVHPVPGRRLRLEVMRGAEAGLKELNMALGERTTYKRGATDFSSQVARMKDAGCDLVVLGTIIRETIGTIATARKLAGRGVSWLVGVLTDLIHKLGGPAMTASTHQHGEHPYMDDASRNVREWATLQAEVQRRPGGVLGVRLPGHRPVHPDRRQAGPKLNVDTFINTLEGFSSTRDMFGADAMSFSKTSTWARTRARLSQIINGKWTPITDYITE